MQKLSVPSVVDRYKLAIGGEVMLQPERAKAPTTYGQVYRYKTNSYECSSDYKYKYGDCKKDDENSANNTDSDDEVDPNYIYTENPLYTCKGESLSLQKTIQDASSPVDKTSPSTTTKKTTLVSKINPRLLNAPSSSKSKTELKAEGRYSIDSMLIQSRLQNKFPKINEIDKSILKRKLFPI